MQLDPNSVVTQEMITKLAELQGINEDVAAGSLAMAERGQGTLDAQIFDTEPVFKPVRDAYFAANGVTNAALSSEEGLAAAEAEKAEEASGEASSTTTAE
jgi:hypothetical protein